MDLSKPMITQTALVLWPSGSQNKTKSHECGRWTFLEGDGIGKGDKRESIHDSNQNALHTWKKLSMNKFNIFVV